MLNLVAFDAEYDRKLLESSYNAIRYKEHLQIVTNEVEKELIYQKTIAALTVPAGVIFSFLNLFKVSLSNGGFYIAQCLLDFGYPISGKLSQSPIRKYDFQIIGIADLTIDLGKTLLRRETRTDKAIGRFWDHDIDFAGMEKFNDKYYLASNKKASIYESFDKQFVNTLARYNDIILMTKGNEMFISFETEMKRDHSGIIEDVFNNCKFLSK